MPLCCFLAGGTLICLSSEEHLANSAGVMVFFTIFSILIFIFSIKTITNSGKVGANRLLNYFSWFLVIYATAQKFGFDFAQLDTRGISPVVLTFGNSNFAGGMIPVLFTYHLIYAVTSKRFPAQTTCLLFSLLISATFPAAVQGYLIILFAFALGISLYIFQKSKSGWAARALVATWALAVLCIVLGIRGTFALAGVFERPSFQARIEYWRIATKVIMDHPFLGVGPDKLYDVSAAYMSPGSLNLITTTRMDNAHNWFLNLATNFGLISLFFLSLILFAVFVTGFRLIREKNGLDSFSLASFGAFCAMFIDGLVSLEQPGLGIWLYFFAGVTIGSYFNTKKKSEHKLEAKILKGLPTKKNFQRALASIPIAAVIFTTATTSTRVIQDGLLRHAIQSQLSFGADNSNLERIASAAVNLKAEPEYAVQSLQSLALAGDSKRIDKVSRAVYDFNKTSVQATLIRADVLRALGRLIESCPLRTSLINNSPWDKQQVETYLICHLRGWKDNNYLGVLKKVAAYKPADDYSEIPADGNEIVQLNSRIAHFAIWARVNLEIGKREEAIQERDYALKLITRILEIERNTNLPLSQPNRDSYIMLLDF